jgi:meiotic recombination protein SPO11
MTAKGQPDVATRMFLSRVTSELHIPVLGLVDSDPYGLKILSVYMSGSKNMSYDSASLTTPDIKWLGLRPSDLDKYDLPDQCRLDMTENDIKTGKELLKEEFIMKNPAWVKEIEIMVRSSTEDDLLMYYLVAHSLVRSLARSNLSLCLTPAGQNKKESRDPGSFVIWLSIHY